VPPEELPPTELLPEDVPPTPVAPPALDKLLEFVVPPKLAEAPPVAAPPTEVRVPLVAVLDVPPALEVCPPAPPAAEVLVLVVPPLAVAPATLEEVLLLLELLVPFDEPPTPVVPPAVTPELPPELLVPLVGATQPVAQSATAMTQRDGRRTIEPAKQILRCLLGIFIVGNLGCVAV